MRRARRSSTTVHQVGTVDAGPTVKGPSAPSGAARRLAQAQTLWLATVRPAGSPHLVPVWFVWLEGCFFVCTEPESVKARNLEANPRVVVALEDGVHPLICEGEGSAIPRPWPQDVVSTFRSKYDWSIETDAQYARLVRVRPTHWLAW